MIQLLTGLSGRPWRRQRMWHTLGVCILAAAVGCDRQPVGMEGVIHYPQPAISETGRPDVVCLLRPFVVKVNPQDQPRFALHWATPIGPGDGGVWNNEVDWRSTLESMDVSVTCPGSQRHHLRLSQFNNSLLTGDPLFLQRSTLFFTLGENEQEAFKWPNTTDFSVDAKGTYRISVSGKVHVTGDAADIPFVTGEVEFEVTDDCLSNASALASASKVIGRYGQLVDNMIFDDRDGNRIVRYRTKRRVGPWSWQEARVLVRPDGSVAGIHYHTIDNCIAEGTVIEAESGPVPVECLKVGTRVWGFDIQRRTPVLTTVRSVRASRAAYTLHFPTGLRVTPEHPVYATGSWKPAAGVQPDDTFLAFNLQTAQAGVCEYHGTPCEVFDITVDAPHNFFAGGVLVHNKDRGYWPFLDDPWYQLWSEPERPTDADLRRAVEAIEDAGGRIRVSAPDSRNLIFRISFEGEKVGLQGVTALRGITGSLEVSFYRAPAVDEQILKQLKGLQNVEMLRIAQCPVSDASLRHLLTWPHIKRLYLDSVPISDAGLGTICEMRYLKELALAKTKITNDGLAQLDQLKQLEHLSLFSSAITEEGLKHIGNLKNLKSLDLADTNITGEGFIHLTGVKRLETLRLPSSAQHLEHLPLDSLKFLNASYTQVDDKSLVHLGGASKLQGISLDHTAVTDEGLKCLQQLPALDSLSISGTNVSDAGLHYLKAVRNLKYLYLRETRVTEQGMRDLEAELPDCEIKR